MSQHFWLFFYRFLFWHGFWSDMCRVEMLFFLCAIVRNLVCHRCFIVIWMLSYIFYDAFIFSLINLIFLDYICKAAACTISFLLNTLCFVQARFHWQFITCG